MFQSHQIITCLLAIAILSPLAFAQRSLVLTTGRNAARDPVGVHAQVVDFSSANVLPGALTLPGSQITHTVDAVSSAGILYLSTGIHSSPGESYMMGLRTFPLERVAISHFPEEEDWSHKVLGTVQDEAGRLHTVALGTAHVSAASKISFYDWSGGRLTKEVFRWGVSREITDALVLEDAQRVVAVYRSSGQRPGGVMSGKMDAAPALRMTLPEPEEGAGVFQPLKVAQYADTLLVLGINTPKDTQAVNTLWVQLLETDTLVPRGRPVQISGTQMGSAEPLLNDGTSGFWISSRSSDTRFAFVSRVSITAAGLEKTASYSLPKTSTPVYMVQAPGSPALALAYNETLEIWPDAKRENMLRRQFTEPLGALAWVDDTQLLLGEAGRIHAVTLSDIDTPKTVQLQSGWIEKIIPIPNDMQNTEVNDKDNDGILDALDREPLNPSPQLELPYKITFRGNAIGHEIRALQFSPKNYEDASWKVDVVDAQSAEWLRMAPQKGFGRSAVYMGVDPERFDRGAWAETWLKVHLDGVTVREAYGSPQWLLVQVQSQPEVLRRILWIWDTTAAAENANLRDDSDPRGVRTLVNLLAAPPFRFSHHEVSGLVDVNLDDYTLLVVPLRALAQGQLIRSDLLDYVVGGGAVLILGDLPINPLPRTLHEWFRPAGVDMLLSSPLSGTFPILPFDGIDGAGTALNVNQGARYISEFGTVVPIEDEKDEAALVAKDYGYGRMLFLSDTSPLRSDAMTDEQHLRFVVSCFTWLAGAGAAFGDMDGDLLVDGMEDSNDNGIVDSGETDFLEPDSDGDYLPDGAEDLNRNGKVDAGETDPRNPDTDNDTIWDAADATPFPETSVQMPLFQHTGGGA